MITRHPKTLATLLALPICMLACERGSSVTRGVDGLEPANRADITAVDVTPPHAEIQVSDRVYFAAQVRSRAGVSHASTVTWSVGDSTVGRIGDSGEFVGQRMGVTWVFAASGGVRDSVAVRVGRWITPEGGTITTYGGQAALTIAAGALDDDVLVTLAQTPKVGMAGSLPGTTWEILPAGRLLDSVALLELRYDTADLALPAEAVNVVPHRLTAGNWIPLKPTFDTVPSRITTTIRRFAVFTATAMNAVVAVPVTPDHLGIEEGDAAVLQATPVDYFGVPMDRLIEWTSSDSTVLRVDSTGRIEAVSEGAAEVFAASESVVGSTAVQIIPAAVARLDVDPRAATMLKGEARQFRSTAFDARHAPLDRPTTWSSSDPTVVTVDDEGMVHAIAAGEAVVTATAESVSSSIDVFVSQVAPETIMLGPVDPKMRAGDTLELTATVSTDGEVVVAPLVWQSSDTSTVRFLAPGIALARSPGQVQLRVEAPGGANATVEALVYTPVSDRIDILPAVTEAAIGETTDFWATLYDQYGRAIGGTPTWTVSPPTVASIDGSGRVLPLAVGEADVSVSQGGRSATARLTVTETGVASIELTPTNTILEVGDSLILNASPRASDGTLLTRAVTYTSSDTAIVRATGPLVTALSPGSAIVTASAGGVGATATIDVSSTRSGLLIEESFELGAILLERTEACCSYSLGRTNAVSREGQWAMRAEVSQTDPFVNLGKRAEYSIPYLDRTVGQAGDERWFGFSIFVPQDWTLDSGEFAVVGQVHARPDQDLGENWRKNPLGLEVHGGNWRIWSRWDSSRVSDPSQIGEALLHESPLERGRWTDWVIRARWSFTDDGLLEVWKDGIQVVSRSGPNMYNDAAPLYFKMGLYFPHWNNPNHTSKQPRRVIFHDALRIGSETSNRYSVSPGGG